jgi:hypothetical protein
MQYVCLRALLFCFVCLQHMAAVRQVFNPLEKDDIIGITNYIDVGIQLHVPLAAAAAADGKGAAAAAAFSSSSSSSEDGTQAGLRLAASWQVGGCFWLASMIYKYAQHRSSCGRKSSARAPGSGSSSSSSDDGTFESFFQPSATRAATSSHMTPSGCVSARTFCFDSTI